MEEDYDFIDYEMDCASLFSSGVVTVREDLGCRGKVFSLLTLDLYKKIQKRILKSDGFQTQNLATMSFYVAPDTVNAAEHCYLLFI